MLLLRILYLLYIIFLLYINNFIKKFIFGDGLCNGKRLIVRSLGEYKIKADIISENKAGITVLIARIDLSPSKE